MEETKQNPLYNKKLKRQKIAIIILSLLLIISTTGWIVNVVINTIETKNLAIDITFTKSYTQQSYLAHFYDIEITCKENQIINVNDFTFKTSAGNYISINEIDYDGKTYKANECLIIYKNNVNKLTLKAQLINGGETSRLHYKSKPIELGTTKKIS